MQSPSANELTGCVVYWISGGLTNTVSRADADRARLALLQPKAVARKCGSPCRVALGVVLLTLVLPGLGAAGQAQPPAVHRKKSAATPKPTPPPEPATPLPPAAPPNMLDQPAVAATVTAHKNVLTVTADNSSLTQILHQIATETGMQLDGLGGDERVFGSFGPAAPREVLTALLNGTGYNVVMVGDLPNGAPRELLLTHRGGSDAKPGAAPQPRATGGDEDSSSDDTGSADDPDEPPPPPPPMQNIPPGQPIPQGVRTPQNWQQLQQMRNLPTSAPPQ